MSKIKMKYLIVIAFILYILLLLWALWLKFGDVKTITMNYYTLSRMNYYERFTYNINPFKLQNACLEGYIQIGLNAVIFFPFGILLRMMFEKKNILRDLFICFLISASIETIQFFSCIGAFATADLIMNTLGYFLGLAIYWLIFKKFPKKAQYITYVIVDILLLIAVVIGIIVTIKYFDQYLILLKKEI